MLESYLAHATIQADALDLAEAVSCIREAVEAFNKRMIESHKPQRLMVDAVSVERPKQKRR